VQRKVQDATATSAAFGGLQADVGAEQVRAHDLLEGDVLELQVAFPQDLQCT
jgi:hypothetical protein